MRRHPSETGSSIFHECELDDDGCMCMYDARCTGEMHRRMVALPLWVCVLRWPRYYFQVWRVGRELERYRGARS